MQQLRKKQEQKRPWSTRVSMAANKQRLNWPTLYSWVIIKFVHTELIKNILGFDYTNCN